MRVCYWVWFSEQICHRLWEPSECSKSCTWRRLAAINFSLESIAAFLEGSLVKWFTDSQSAAKIAEVGCMKLDLQRLVVKIFQFCAQIAEYGRTRRDLARAEPFFAPFSFNHLDIFRACTCHTLQTCFALSIIFFWRSSESRERK